MTQSQVPEHIQNMIADVTRIAKASLSLDPTLFPCLQLCSICSCQIDLSRSITSAGFESWERIDRFAVATYCKDHTHLAIGGTSDKPLSLKNVVVFEVSELKDEGIWPLIKSYLLMLHKDLRTTKHRGLAIRPPLTMKLGPLAALFIPNQEKFDVERIPFPWTSNDSWDAVIFMSDDDVDFLDQRRKTLADGGTVGYGFCPDPKTSVLPPSNFEELIKEEGAEWVACQLKGQAS